MTLPESFALVSFTLFSFADMRYRLVPGIELFFLGAILIALPATPMKIGIILLACIWGLLRRFPSWTALPLLFFPSVWPLMLTGYGYRKGIIGRADLLAIVGLACLFPWPAIVLSLLGLEVWHRVWVRRQKDLIPALPGMLLGILVYIVMRVNL